MLSVCYLDDGTTIKKGLLQVRHCVCYKFVTGSVTSSSLGLLPVPHWVTGTEIKKGSVTSSSLGLLPVLHWVTGTVNILQTLGNVPLYVHKKSNHPPSILKNIPDSINKRLSEISSDRHCFDNAKTVYQEALNKSGYNYNLSYNEPRNEIQHSRKNRPRNILWYNPPFSKNVKTNVGKCFLSLIDQHFPNSHSLHKIFNRNTLKLSYSCMTNIKTIISNHNKAQIKKSDPTHDSNCNCRNSSMCPMDGKCNDQNMIYQAEVTTTTSRETYISLILYIVWTNLHISLQMIFRRRHCHAFSCFLKTRGHGSLVCLYSFKFITST